MIALMLIKGKLISIFTAYRRGLVNFYIILFILTVCLSICGKIVLISTWGSISVCSYIREKD